MHNGRPMRYLRLVNLRGKLLDIIESSHVQRSAHRPTVHKNIGKAVVPPYFIPLV